MSCHMPQPRRLPVAALVALVVLGTAVARAAEPPGAANPPESRQPPPAAAPQPAVPRPDTSTEQLPEVPPFSGSGCPLRNRKLELIV